MGETTASTSSPRATREALGALIGRKGERLSALQHLVNLMLSKEMGAWTRVLVDVEDYRGRRERRLRELAERAAARVVETGKMLQLEPMPALERRWIHLTLAITPGSPRSRSGRSRTAASSSFRGPADSSPTASFGHMAKHIPLPRRHHRARFLDGTMFL